MRRNNVVKIGQRLPSGTKKLIELDHPPNPNNDIIWDERGAEYFKEAEKYPAKVMIGVAISSKGASRVVIYHGIYMYESAAPERQLSLCATPLHSD